MEATLHGTSMGWRVKLSRMWHKDGRALEVSGITTLLPAINERFSVWSENGRNHRATTTPVTSITLIDQSTWHFSTGNSLYRLEFLP